MQRETKHVTTTEDRSSLGEGMEVVTGRKCKNDIKKHAARITMKK